MSAMQGKERTAMSWLSLSSSQPHGRKAYRCDLCGLKIKKGAKHWAIVGKLDGKVYTSRCHAVCNQATRNWDQMDFDCADEYEFRKHDLKLPLMKEIKI